MNYKVSVVVPVYNEEKYLHQCITSLLKQTFSSVQIILVDDGSRDSSGEIIDKYAKEYPNIESYHKENGGLPSARNFGLAKVKGEYVAFLDSDDWLEYDTIEILYNIAMKHGKVDVVQFRAFEEASYYIPRNGYYDFSEIKEDLYPHSMPSFTKEGKPSFIRWSSCMRFYRTKMIEDNHLRFREEALTFEDFLFTFDSILVAQSYYFYNEKPLYHVVANPMSMTRNYQPAMLKTCDFIFSVLNTYFDDNFEYSNLFSYYDTMLYFADACITNEMSQKSLISNIIRIKKVLNSSMCKYLRENDGHNVTGWYGKVLQLIKRNSAVYLVYRYKIRKYILRLYGKIKH